MRKDKFWLKDMEVKESVSKKSVVSKIIIKIGEDILNDMLLKKYSKMI